MEKVKQNSKDNFHTYIENLICKNDSKFRQLVVENYGYKANYFS